MKMSWLVLAGLWVVLWGGCAKTTSSHLLDGHSTGHEEWDAQLRASLTLTYLNATKIERLELITVGANAPFTTVTAALASVADQTDRVLIVISPGTYYEKIIVNRPLVSLWSPNAQHTTIHYDDASGTPRGNGDLASHGQAGSATVTLTPLATGFTAEGITFKNSFNQEQPKDNIYKGFQAVALRVVADQTLLLNSVITSHQNTLLLEENTRTLIAHSTIEGNMDAVLGAGQLYVTHSEIRFMPRLLGESEGFLFQPQTPPNQYGFLIHSSRFTSPPEMRSGTVWLGRPGTAHAQVDIKDSTFGNHLHPEGWTTLYTQHGPLHPQNARLGEDQELTPHTVLGARKGQYAEAWLAWQVLFVSNP
jgi:pectin methylesterase-like acyl-CoA thioesterase